MATSAKPMIDEALVNLYEEHFLTHADTVYRFAFALTLSLDGASLCVQETYKVVADNLAKYASTAETNANAILLDVCWTAYEQLKSKAFVVGQSAVIKALAPLALEARAALVAVDVAGLDVAEAARVLRISDKDLRVHLAHARRNLLASAAQL